MKKTLAILGSTGSVGKSVLDIVYKDKSKFDIQLLTAKSDYINLYKQAKKFDVKNLIILNKKSFENLKKKKI